MSTPATRQQLMAHLKPVFNRLGANPSNLIRRVPGKKKLPRRDAVYEVYLYTVVIEVLESFCGNGSVQLKFCGRHFHVRLGPGYLVNTPRPYSYVAFTCNAKAYELHLDTKYTTACGQAELEVDVSILPQSEAVAVRSKIQPQPRHSSLRLLLEAKDYSDNASTSPAKMYLGTCATFFPVAPHAAADGLVLSGTISGNASRAVTGMNLHVYPEITPLRCHQANVAHFKQDLANHLMPLL